jgi:DNA-binding response OmpR family regulator
VSLPAHAFEAQAVGPVEVDDDEPQAEMKVLVIDDERAILRVLARGLPRRGAFVVTTAASAEEALDVIATDEEFDAILLDRSLGFTDGSDLIADLRSRWPGATLAFFTGQPLSPEEQDAVDLAIYKPVAITELAERLREVV